MGILDDAIREHLDLKRKHGAREDEVRNLEDSAFGGGDLPDPFASGDLFGQSASQVISTAASSSLDSSPQPVDSSDEEPTRIVEPPTAPQAQPPDPSPPAQAHDSAPTQAPEPTPPTPQASASAAPEAPEQPASAESTPPGQVPLDVREAPAPFDFDAAEPPDPPDAAEPPDPQASATQHAPAEAVEDAAPAPPEPAREPEPPPPAPEPPSPAPEPEPSESLADLLAEEDLEPQPPEEMDVADRRAAAPEPPPPPPLSAEGTRPQDTAMSRPIPLPDETLGRSADTEAPSEPADTELEEPASPSPAAGPEPPGRARGRVHHETQEHPAPEPPSEEIEFDGPPSSEPLEPAGAASAAGVFDFEAEAGDAGVTAGDEVEPAAEPAGPSDDFEELGPPTDERPFEPAAEPADDAEPVWDEEGSDEFPATEVSPTPETAEEDLLAESPDFVEESTDEEDLWFEKGPPKDFDFEDER